MCGIAGLFDVGARIPDAAARDALLRAMTECLRHRGPDAHGIWHDPQGRCSLGHRRLSIIDTSEAGRQPMANADGRWVISFNGEIFNFQELRDGIRAAGLPLRGRTDTEVLLQTLAGWGVEGLTRLDGQYALAAFDTQTGELILARDPFGEKPLYYAELPGGGLAFASELQAIERLPGLDPTVSLDAVAEFLMFQYVGAPRSIYESVKKLPPGHWLSARPGRGVRVGRHFQFQPGTGGFDDRPLAALADEVEDILVRSLRRRLIADVPVGALLSGGVDSSTACALIRRTLGLPLRTFSIGFEGSAESEHETARAFARHLGTEHHEQIVAPRASEFLLEIGRLQDEPNGDSSCLPTYLLSRFTRQSVTVALSGDGGDEMFGGYSRYFLTLDEAARHGAGDGWHAGHAYYSNRILIFGEEHLAELLGFVPDGAGAHLDALRAQLAQPFPPLACLLRQTDVDHYLPGAVLAKVDRMSMQHSLEVRTPYLAVELARFVERLPPGLVYRDGRGKPVLREVAYRHLPRELVDRPKQGFGLPTARWGEAEILDAAAGLLEAEDGRLRAALGPGAIERFLKRQRDPDGFSTYQVWAVGVLESWLRHHPARLPEVEPPPRGFIAASACPVQVPDPAAVAPPGPADATDALWAWPVGRGVHAVLEDPAIRLDLPPGGGSPAALRATATFEQLLRLMGSRVERGGTAADDRAGASGVRRLPGWAGLAGREWSEAAGRVLRGAVLLFPQSNVPVRATWRVLERLRRLGVRALEFPHPYRGDGTVLALRLNAKPAWRRIADGWRLARYGSGRRRFLRARRMSGSRFQAGPIAGVPAVPDEELAGRFLLFEGLRQMPPLPVPHGLIETVGGGHYSIWNRECYFSPSSRLRGRLWPRWTIENKPDIAPLLQFVPETLGPERGGGAAEFLARLAGRAATDREPAGAWPLRPGDAVVVVTHGLSAGGAERQWCYLAQELARRGLGVTFVVFDSPEGPGAHYLPLLESAGIPVTSLARESMLDTLRGLPPDAEDRRLASWPGNPLGTRLPQLVALLRRLAPRALFAQLDYTNLLAGTAALLAGVPRIALSFRNYNPTRISYLTTDWHRSLYLALLRSPRVRLAGNAREANADYARWLGLAESRIAFIPNAIVAGPPDTDGAADRAALRQELGVSEADPVILGVFRLSEEKRPELFVETCARVAARVPGLRVLVAGVGPLERAMRRRIAETGMSATIRLLGRREDVPALMGISSVLLLTSSLEGMPNVVMEAQLAGIPVVASGVGGVPSCLEDGVAGHVVAPADEQGFVDRCVDLLGDRARARRMGQAGADRMRRSFFLADMADRYLQLVAWEASGA